MSGVEEDAVDSTEVEEIPLLGTSNRLEKRERRIAAVFAPAQFVHSRPL
ncbi:hypothetical protein SV7mr_26540 [Stieleria bergensis]|uniref:Uncharacterized protein n=1 Tax=Stieleria bergensis TaxID=2528025 RepID=A0A517SVH5_9BACT|nr:hypothetical protein SV7mr_26540 [Planctomycetes bacterium SV_7m_r]